MELAGSVSILAAVTLLAWLSSRRLDVAGIAAGLCLLAGSLVELGIGTVSLLLAAAAAIVLAVSVVAAVRGGVFRLERRRELKIWRLAARPFALLFVPLDLLWGRRLLLVVAGLVCLVFIGLDVFRYVSRRRLAAMYKKSEERRFSSMTFFLLALFLGFLVFPGGVPYLPLAFSTIGDLCGKLAGMRFGATPLYGEKTVQGTLAFMAGSLLAGWLLHRLLGLPVVFVLAGAPFAAAVELLSVRLDDNFSVLLITGGFLAALRYFFGV
jgi:glycerol-3-phosphate acyltransferase PlsY